VLTLAIVLAAIGITGAICQPTPKMSMSFDPPKDEGGPWGWIILAAIIVFALGQVMDGRDNPPIEFHD
jgi:hypothetical protein